MDIQQVFYDTPKTDASSFRLECSPNNTKTMTTNQLLLQVLLFSLSAEAVRVLHTRDYFYVGGQYTTTPAGEHLFENQMYVEHLTPAEVTQPHPIVFMHGGAQSGTVSKQARRPLLTNYIHMPLLPGLHFQLSQV